MNRRGLWTEDTPTKTTDGGHVYGQHSDTVNPHRFRFVYSDGTPMRGEAGKWGICWDCKERDSE